MGEILDTEVEYLAALETIIKVDKCPNRPDIHPSSSIERNHSERGYHHDIRKCRASLQHK